MGRVTVTSRMSQVIREEEAKMDAALGEWASDTHNVAGRLAPHETGALQNSGRIEREKPLEWSVTFGNNQVPYARRRHYENYLNPHTLNYLERAGDQNSRNFVQRYLRRFL